MNFVPLGGAGIPTALELPGRPVSADDQATYLTVSASYLHTMGIPLVAGRWFSPAEMRAPGDGIVVANRSRSNSGPAPIRSGRRSRSIAFRKVVRIRARGPSTVIGVVGDVLQFGPDWGPR